MRRYYEVYRASGRATGRVVEAEDRPEGGEEWRALDPRAEWVVDERGFGDYEIPEEAPMVDNPGKPSARTLIAATPDWTSQILAVSRGTDEDSKATRESAHTPGPWGIDLDDDWVDIHDSEDDLIARMWMHPYPRNLQDIEDNARLIAAAPELLDAVERLEAGVRLWTSRGVSDEDMKAAQAAIAKAKGEAQ